MKNLLLLSTVFLLAFVSLAQAEELDLARYGVADDETAAMQQLRQGQNEEPLMEQTQARVQVMDGSGAMIQERIQERIQTMQARKSQLREALKVKNQLQEKQEVLQKYKGNEVSEFVKGINNRSEAQSDRFNKLSNKLSSFEDKLNARIEKMSNEDKRLRATDLQNQFLQQREMLGNRLGELEERRAQLSELKSSEEWKDLYNQMENYKSLLQEARDELKAAISAAQELETISE